MYAWYHFAMSERKRLRDENGLLRNINYIFNEDGSVNWRAMLKSEFLYPNPDWFKRQNIPQPDSVEGLEDKQLLIYLAGLKDVAKIRGFKSVEFEVYTVNPEHIQAKCRIHWIPNFESDFCGQSYEEIASATKLNADAFGLKFGEAIACNRAFVRCVRNYLGINIVGADELDKSKNGSSNYSESPPEYTTVGADSSQLSPQGLLESNYISKHQGNNDVKKFIKYMRSIYKKLEETSPDKMQGLSSAMEGSDTWSSFNDISSKSARILLSILNEK